MERKSREVHLYNPNSSKDILASDRDRLFDLFYCGDPARTRKVEGIGLSLASEIVRAQSGNLTLDSISSGQTGFTLTLPIDIVDC